MRGVIARWAPYSSGYAPDTLLQFKPADSSNPTTATETAGSEEMQWDHDVSPELLEADIYPWQDIFPEENGYIDIHANGTGAQMSMIYVPVDPKWAQSVIADKSISQNGTLGNWDKYDLVDGSYTLKCECDGVSYTISGAPDDQGGYILLWTADNNAYASVYLNMVSSDDDTALWAKICAANPGQWETDGFIITADLYP